MKKTRKKATLVSADAAARSGDSGFRPIQRVNLDVTASMLEELDRAAQELNVSRQAVIKTLLRQALDQHYLAQGARRSRTS